MTLTSVPLHGKPSLTTRDSSASRANAPLHSLVGMTGYGAANQLTLSAGAGFTCDPLGERTKTDPTSESATSYAYNQAGSRPLGGATAATYGDDGTGLRVLEDDRLHNGPLHVVPGAGAWRATSVLQRSRIPQPSVGVTVISARTVVLRCVGMRIRREQRSTAGSSLAQVPLQGRKKLPMR